MGSGMACLRRRRSEGTIENFIVDPVTGNIIRAPAERNDRDKGEAWVESSDADMYQEEHRHIAMESESLHDHVVSLPVHRSKRRLLSNLGASSDSISEVSLGSFDQENRQLNFVKLEHRDSWDDEALTGRSMRVKIKESLSGSDVSYSGRHRLRQSSSVIAEAVLGTDSEVSEDVSAAIELSASSPAPARGSMSGKSRRGTLSESAANLSETEYFDASENLS